ncbi:MAG: SIS domain-containing protein [Thermosynechococcaceae cyanobacterium]
MSYLDNICEQPQGLRSVTQRYKEAPEWEQLYQGWSARSSHRLVLTGLGASFNALYPARYYLHRQGLAALHVDTGELIHYLPEWLDQPLVLVVVSQSGESVEVRKLLERMRASTQRPSSVWLVSVTNQPGNTLAQQSNLAFYTHSGAEVGVATKTYTSTLALLHWLARALVGTLRPQDYLDVVQAAQVCESLLAHWQTWLDPAVVAVQPAANFALVARGPSIASACNGALILQEAARRMAAGFVGSQFRHGPMELISPQLATVLFTLPGRTLDLSQRMAQDICDRSGCLVTIGERLPGLRGVHLSLPTLNEWISPMVDILPIQLLAAQLAAADGIVPGQFRWSGKVIQEE